MSNGSKRENHLVPQFYLRHFSSAPKRINLFNFARHSLILGASIKHQCSRRNFYQFAPSLEDAFAELEGNAARVIRSIEEDCCFPDSLSDDWLSLLSYILFQYLRTSNAARLTDALTEYVGQLIVENDAKFADIDPASVKLRSSHPVAVPLSIARDLLPIAHSLRAHLFVNTTDQEFITSDDPVVLHNQFCEGITHDGINGWNCSGIQAFLPISPRKLIVLYDHNTYVIFQSGPDVHSSKLTREFDVVQLYSLQILNAHKNIYFAGRTGVKKTVTHCEKLSVQRPSERSTFVETEAIENTNGTSSAILCTFQHPLPIKLRVSKIRIKKHVKKIPLRDRSNMYRVDLPPAHENQLDRNEIAPGPYRVMKTTRI